VATKCCARPHIIMRNRSAAGSGTDWARLYVAAQTVCASVCGRRLTARRTRCCLHVWAKREPAERKQAARWNAIHLRIELLFNWPGMKWIGPLSLWAVCLFLRPLVIDTWLGWRRPTQSGLRLPFRRALGHSLRAHFAPEARSQLDEKPTKFNGRASHSMPELSIQWNLSIHHHPCAVWRPKQPQSSQMAAF